jgi:Mg/Co/Ni transporter MgtE
VYDYTAGKLDWLAAGLPIEGEFAGRPTAGSVARRDVPTCRLDEPIDAVRERVRGVGWDACVVTNQEGVVLGLLREQQLDAPARETVEQAMRPGPSTFRPHLPIAEMAQRMREHDTVNVPVTTSDGRLVGLLRREDAERAAEELHRAHHEHEEDDHVGA